MQFTPEQQAEIEALEREAAALEQAAEAAELSPFEKAKQAALERAQAAADAKASAEAARRQQALATLLAEARKECGRAAILAGVDLVALFPAGFAPPPEHLPGEGDAKGVVVIRDAAGEEEGLLIEVEAKTRSLTQLQIEGACKILVKPDPKTPEGARFRSFCERYPAAAGQVFGRARELGGARAKGEKRSRG